MHLPRQWGRRKTGLIGLALVGAICGGWVALRTDFVEEQRAELRRTHAHMREWSLKETADGGREFGPARLWRHAGINLLSLRGDRYEMAYQHGRLLGDEIADGAIPATLSMLRRMVMNSYGHLPLAVPLASALYDAGVADRMALAPDHFTAATSQALADGLGMSDATQIPFRDLARALTMPEGLQYVGGYLLKDGGQKLLLMPPVGACSSFAAFGQWTKSGAPIIGRNMDFPLNGAYDKHPTVIYFEPKDGQRYMTFVSSGVHNQGLTAYNESGIFLSIHTVMTRDIGIAGAVPVFILGAEAIRRAHTFDEAVAVLRSAPTYAGWSYMVVSAKERRVGVVDLDHTGAAVRETTAEGRVAQTNHHLTPEKRDRNLFISRGIAEDNDGRYIRAMEMLEAHKGALDASTAMAMLADHGDAVAGGITRGLGNIVGTHVTMTSVVVDPDAGRAWIARGAGPVSHNSYVAVPLIGSLSADDLGAYPVEVVANDAFRREHPRLSEAVDKFLVAKLAWENDNDPVKALANLELASALDPEESAYRFQAGIFALMLGKWQVGADWFAGAAVAPKTTAHLQLLISYYRGRALAQLGSREAAVEALSRVASDQAGDAKLRGAATEAQAAVEADGQLDLGRHSLGIMMQQTDMMEY